MLLKAIDIATRAHEGQFRMDGKTPYISHPLSVMEILNSEGFYYDERILAAAVLHDVIEDCARCFEHEVSAIGDEVYTWVRALTCTEDEEVYNKTFNHFPNEVHWIKCADILHNVSTHPSPNYARKKMRQLLSMNRRVRRDAIFQRSYELCKSKIEQDMYD